MEEGFDGADRQVRADMGLRVHNTLNTAHWRKDLKHTLYTGEKQQRLETQTEHCKLEKSPAMSDMGLRWTGLPVIGPTTTDQEC